jgi:hypothetical protein
MFPTHIFAPGVQVPTQLPASSLAFVTLLFWLMALPREADTSRVA